MRNLILTIITVYIIFTRFVGINWGLPYPMHPDERNMVMAVQQLNCEIQNSKFKIQNCFDPKFYAYGQLPLYVGYAMIKGYHFIHFNTFDKEISFDEGTIALRIISAVSSLLMVLILYKIVAYFLWEIRKPKLFEEIIAILLLAIVPYLIQFSHFGTTESLLMVLYSGIILKSLHILKNKNSRRLCIETAILCGVAIGVKLSSVFYVGIFLCALLYSFFMQNKQTKIQNLITVFKLFCFYSLFVVVGVFLSSPYNFISFREFIGSMRYESAVALGTIEVFYTRPFFSSISYYFHIIKVFPYAIGLPAFLVFCFSFFLLPSKQFKWWFIRIAFLIPFITTGFMFAKWSRFMSPTFPVISLIMVLGVLSFYRSMYDRFISKFHKGNVIFHLVFSIFILLLIIPGIAYIAIYQHEDVRFTASRFIQNNIPDNTKILSETANVVDIPLNVPSPSFKLLRKNLNILSFNFYDVDTDDLLQKQLQDAIHSSDYFFVPSRRIYANHTCITPKEYYLKHALSTQFSFKSTRCIDLLKKYPVLNQYYMELFNQAKYQKIAEITSYPKISLFGKTVLEFPDEDAEETWTVFDHPVIRIYKKNYKY